MAKKAPKIKKPTRGELLTVAARNANKDLHTASVESKMRIANFEIEELELALIGYKAATARANIRKAELLSMVSGLQLVLERR